MAFKYSFQLYSARKFWPLADQLPKLKAMGYDAVEPWLPAYEDSAEGFRTMIDDAGLACSGFHMPLSGLVEETGKYIDIAQAMGAQVMIPPYLAPDERGSTADFWKRLGETLALGADRVAPHGLKVAWHNHDFEFMPLSDGTRPIDHILGSADNFGFEIDCGWIVRAGGDPAEALVTFADRIYAIQPKDTAPIGTSVDGGWATVGKGIIDWPALAPLFGRTAADYIVTEHDDPSDWVAFAGDSLAYLKSLPID